MPDFINAVIISADPTCTPYLTGYPVDADGSALATLQAAVGGSVDVLRLADGLDMWINDEGAINGMPFNRAATEVAHMVKAALATGEYPAPAGADMADMLVEAVAWISQVRVFGSVIITGHDGEGNTTSVPDEAVKFFREIMLIA